MAQTIAARVAAVKQPGLLERVVEHGAPLPRHVVYVLLFAAVTLVIPILEVPRLGLSISAPAFFFIVLEVYFRVHSIRLRDYAAWIGWAYLFWFALFLSIAGNVILGNAPYAMGDIILLIQYMYWTTIFVTTIIIASQTNLLWDIVILLGTAGVGLCLVRIFEFVFYHNWGGNNYATGAYAQFFTQNTYGLFFSTFTPFILSLPFLLTSKYRLMGLASIPLAIMAVVGNASRGGWIAAGVGVVLYLVLYWLFSDAKHKLLGLMMAFVGLTLLIAVILPHVPTSISEPLMRRINTFSDLQDDHSTQVREFQLRKGLALFRENPILGIGIGRFPETVSYIDVDRTLQNKSPVEQKSAHSTYVSLLAETGILGVTIYGILMLTLGIRGLFATIRLARREQLFALTILVSVVSMSVHLVTVNALTGTTPWFIFGLLAGMVEYAKRQEAAL